MTLHFFLTALVVVLAPGTGVIYTLAMGLGQGRRAAIASAFGCTVGIVPHLAAATRAYLLRSETVMRWMNRSFAAVFAALAAKLAVERA